MVGGTGTPEPPPQTAITPETITRLQDRVGELWDTTGVLPISREDLEKVDKKGACWIRVYGRGAGTIPSACPGGTERDGLLCYPNCQAGYYGVGPVCWQTCASTHTVSLIADR